MDWEPCDNSMPPGMWAEIQNHLYVADKPEDLELERSYILSLHRAGASADRISKALETYKRIETSGAVVGKFIGI